MIKTTGPFPTQTILATTLTNDSGWDSSNYSVHTRYLSSLTGLIVFDHAYMYSTEKWIDCFYPTN